MCGIVGILGKEAAAPQLVDGLKRLEYRGYDSAGVATLEGGAHRPPPRRGQAAQPRGAARTPSRSPARPASATPAGRRTARRPRPTPIRTRPTGSRSSTTASSRTSASCATSSKPNGAVFQSQTDTEVVAHLVEPRARRAARRRGRRSRTTLARLRGAFALAFIFAGEDDLLIGARRGSPLAIGHGDGEVFLGSDAVALAPFTDAVTYLDDGDWAALTRSVDRDLRRKRRARSSATVVRSLGRRRRWSTRAPTGTSWRRRSPSSPRSSAIR